MTIEIYLKGNTKIIDQCNCSNHRCNIFKWNEGVEDDVRHQVLMNTQRFEDLLLNMDENIDIDNCVDNLNKVLTDIFEQNTKSESIYREHCDFCVGQVKTFIAKNDKRWFNQECKTLYKQYQMALDRLNKYRSNENRLSLNLAKQRYKYLENKLKRQNKNQQGNMLSKLRKSNPKRFNNKFKKRKQPVIHDISLEKFEEHFKNLTSKDNTGDINHDTTETVFDELDRPFDENELDVCITKLKRNKAIGIDNIMNEYILMSKNLIKPVLCKLFNNILNTGNFPKSGSEVS